MIGATKRCFVHDTGGCPGFRSIFPGGHLGPPLQLKRLGATAMRILTLNSLALLLALTTSVAFANGFPASTTYDAANAKKSSASASLCNSAPDCLVTTTPAPVVKKVKPVKKSVKTVCKKPFSTSYVYSAMLYQGSLRHNIIRIAHNYGWDTVVWTAPEDYLWSGYARVTGNSLQELFSKILIKYPLQAQFYSGNHVLAIVPRNLP